MPVVYKTGNVLDSEELIIVHGCNCFCTMGSGIAREIADRYPEVPAADQRTVNGDPLKLGTIEAIPVTTPLGKPRHIINAYTQYDFSRTGRAAEYSAIKECLKRVANRFSDEVPIALPKIGCGLGGANWDVVYHILYTIGEQYNVTFHVYVL